MSELIWKWLYVIIFLREYLGGENFGYIYLRNYGMFFFEIMVYISFVFYFILLESICIKIVIINIMFLVIKIVISFWWSFVRIGCLREIFVFFCNDLKVFV